MGSIAATENGIDDIHQSSNAYVIPEKRLGDARQIRIITIGAGASGLNLARQLELHMQNIEHIIYEKNADVGGTWLENK